MDQAHLGISKDYEVEENNYIKCHPQGLDRHPLLSRRVSMGIAWVVWLSAVSCGCVAFGLGERASKGPVSPCYLCVTAGIELFQFGSQ